MRLRKILPVLTAMVMLSGTLTACGKEPNKALPTLAPTPTPKSEVKEGPTPTTAPDRDYTKIVELTGEDYNQTENFTINNGKLSVLKKAHSGQYSFCLSDRESSVAGATINFVKVTDAKTDVIGKKAHIAVWVYQETGQAQTFECTLSAKQQDNTSVTPVHLEYANIPSGQWTLLESDFAVPAGVKAPTVSVNMSSASDDFYFDDLRLSVDTNSTVAALETENKEKVEVLLYRFENGQKYFTSRGDASLDIVSGAADGSDYLSVSGRTANWHGAQVDVSNYGFEGKTISVSFDAKQKGNTKAKVICTFELKRAGSSDTVYQNVGMTDTLSADSWGKGSGTYEVPSDTETLVFYFETEGTEDFCVDNVLITTLDPASLDTTNMNPDVRGVVSAESGSRIDTGKFKEIHYLSADSKKDEKSLLVARGLSKEVKISNNGKFENCFLISGRTASWNGVGIDFTSIDGTKHDVIGKDVFISFWVYQESGETVEFNATLQVNKPDGSTAWPERVGITSLESGKWTYVEGIVPVYANITAPRVNFEIPGNDTADFMLDNITIMVDPNSTVPINENYVVKEKKQFTKLSLSFEDNNAFFEGRGNAHATIAYGGHESEKCLGVVGRTASWHGAQADLSEYDLAGKTIKVSYWLYHEYATPISIAFTAQQNDGTNETYTPVVSATEMADGKWVQFTGTFTFDSNAKKYYLYFESPSETAEFYVDDVVIELQ